MTPDPEKHGWSKLILYAGETQSDFLRIDPRHMARDCVLCPVHALILNENVLVGIGGRLRNAAGNA